MLKITLRRYLQFLEFEAKVDEFGHGVLLSLRMFRQLQDQFLTLLYSLLQLLDVWRHKRTLKRDQISFVNYSFSFNQHHYSNLCLSLYSQLCLCKLFLNATREKHISSKTLRGCCYETTNQWYDEVEIIVVTLNNSTSISVLFLLPKQFIIIIIIICYSLTKATSDFLSIYSHV